MIGRGAIHLLLLAGLAFLPSAGLHAAALPALSVQPGQAPEAALAGADGPYVAASGNGLIARWTDRAGRAHQRRVRPGDRLEIAAVNDVPAFRVRLRPPVALPPPSVQPLASVPVLVVADTHGEYEILVALLRRQGVIDAGLRWTFGRGHLVVLGDMLDRGPNQIEILWLFYKLEEEARQAGGDVHVLLGNHEAMVMRGDLRYLNPRYVRSAAVLGATSYDALLGETTLLGRWLRSKPAIIRLGDMLFLHGGVSPELIRSGLTLEQINAASRQALAIPVAERERLDETARLVTGQHGPLWYRGYFEDMSGFTVATDADITASLGRFGVSRIFVGHTIVPTVTPLHGGRVVAVQVYPSRDDRTGTPVMEGAMRANGLWYRARVDGSRERLELE